MFLYVLMVIVILFDQLTKWLTRSWLCLGQRITLIDGLLELTHYENAGAAFSWMEGHRMLLIFLPALVLAVALYFLVTQKKANVVMKLAVVLISAGGIGNLIDRIFRGSVTDMISVSFFPPIFNVADISVCIGCGLLFYYVLFISKGDDYE